MPVNAATANVSISFNQPVQVLASKPFSSTISTYAGGGGSIVAAARQRSELGALGLGYYRVPLQWNNGTITSSATGGPRNVSGDQWISSIKAFGGTPMIVIGGTSDNNFTPTDAANIVRHFDAGANKVDRYVLGNEPGNAGMSISSYCTLFNASVDAMKAVDPTIKVAGPAWAFYDQATYQAFLNCAGSKVDIIDFHHYAMGGSSLDNATALSQTGEWETQIKSLRSMIQATAPARASQIEIQVGEYNWSWQTADGFNGYNGDDRFYQAVTTVWAASVAAHIAQAGGRGNQYSDQNGALGLTFENQADASHFGTAINDPMPIYYGLQMLSGGQLFRGFGTTMVSATTSLPNVEVYASTNAKNIVLINKGPSLTQSALIGLTGASKGTAGEWQTSQSAPFATPKHVTTLSYGANGQLAVSLPPYSVTTLVLNDSTMPTVTPAPRLAILTMMGPLTPLIFRFSSPTGVRLRLLPT